MTPTLYTIRQLCELEKEGLLIAPFQRHYLWGQYRKGEKDAVDYLTRCLVDAYHTGKGYFLQSITVHDHILVDGQQRMTYLCLLTSLLESDTTVKLLFTNRPAAQKWLDSKDFTNINENPEEKSQDIYYYKRTLRTIKRILQEENICHKEFLDFILDDVSVLLITLPQGTNVNAIYKMMNGTKAPMHSPDIIKADIMRMASDPEQPNAFDWEISYLRTRYANEWDIWVRWWNREDVTQYYSPCGDTGITILLKICLRASDADYSIPLTYEEFRQYIQKTDNKPYHAAKHFFYTLRCTQRRFEEAFSDTCAFNRIRAILLLQKPKGIYQFLHLYFTQRQIDEAELERYYKLSFLGMTIDEIYRHEPFDERFDDLHASLSMADVYHSETKRDVFNLLLRLNIDEDIKLGRKFDFRVWNHRSLEHIYSKSKVWHCGPDGEVLDGNDNPITIPRHKIEKDPEYMCRSKIKNYDGTQLSEHCIGNLVLLYGDNNASFGNTGFDKKKLMFLTPGDQTVFQSRNLLHSVCVFAGNSWDHTSIIDNYNLTLKNLKIYYGY